MIAGALASTDHPLLAHHHPGPPLQSGLRVLQRIRRFSKPVPTETMFQRVDKLAALGTSVITISGGEPLLHPELDEIISRIRKRGMIAGMITMDISLWLSALKRLDRAGLEWLKFRLITSADDVSKKA